MKIIQYLFSAEIIEALGWTLVHSLWQGASVVIALMILLLVMRHHSARIKYLISFIALAGLMAWSAATFVHSYNYAMKKAVLRENILSSPGYIRTLLKQEVALQTHAEKPEKGSPNFSVIRVRGFFQRHFDVVCTFWIIGMLLLVFRLIGGFLHLQRIRSANLIIIDKEWMDKLYELADKLQIKRRIKAFFSPYVKTPLTLGSLKPVLLFPLAVFTGFSTKEVEAIIAHELAHVLRHDYFFNILQSVLEIFFFYNPAVWVISSQIRKERENSCDDIAIELTGDKVAFAKALAGIQIRRMEQERLAMAFSSSKGSIVNRIKRMQKKGTMKTNFMEGLIAAGIIVAGLTLASFSFGDHGLVNVKGNDRMAEMNNAPDTVDAESGEKYTSEDIDSIYNATQQNLQKNESLESSEELKAMLEIALSEEEEEISAEMLEDINDVMKEINVEQIVREAMDVAAAALKEARKEIDREDLRKDMREAAREIEAAKREVEEEIRREMEHADGIERESMELGLEAAKAGLEIASVVVENLPLEEIIEASLLGVAEALEEIDETDFDSLYKEGDLSREELEQLKKQMENNHKQLNEQLKELEKQMKELDKQIHEK
ncbi:MAG: M48 family metalloprotease [Bacteroidales bacterium]|nr:M48 family metalloprotease [Bacteroidales bacterium]